MADTSFDDLGFEQDLSQQEEEVQQPKRKFIIRSERIDPYSTKRTRKILTPSMCTKLGCNFDAAAKAGGWEYLDQANQRIVKEVLQKHIEEVHNASEEYIIDEDSLPKNWLGGDPKKGIHKDI